MRRFREAQHRQAAIRLFYFAAVLLLALWLGDLFLGSLFYLRRPGPGDGRARGHRGGISGNCARTSSS